jgi:toxin ParE1/3/4
MKLRFTPRAAQDLADIADYIRERNPAAALRVRAAILESLQLVTQRYRYLVYYTAESEADEIVILTIQHPAQEREHSDA